MGARTHRVSALAAALVGRVRSGGARKLDYSKQTADAMIRTTLAWVDGVRTPPPVPVVAIGHSKDFTPESERQLDRYLGWAAEQDWLRFSTYGAWEAALGD
jgi:hypothetical protein